MLRVSSKVRETANAEQRNAGDGVQSHLQRPERSEEVLPACSSDPVWIQALSPGNLSDMLVPFLLHLEHVPKLLLPTCYVPDGKREGLALSLLLQLRTHCLETSPVRCTARLLCPICLLLRSRPLFSPPFSGACYSPFFSSSAGVARPSPLETPRRLGR